MDELDHKILKILTENAKISWKELGEIVHMTGQAVGNRIRRLEDEGVITGYRITVDNNKTGYPLTCFITSFLKNHQHNSFINMIKEKDEIVELHRTSGEGCYILKGRFRTHQDLNKFLEELLIFANYKLALSIDKII